MRHEQGKPRRQFKNYNNFNTKLKKKEFKKYPKDTGLMVTVRGDTEQDMTKAKKRFKRIHHGKSFERNILNIKL